MGIGNVDGGGKLRRVEKCGLGWTNFGSQYGHWGLARKMWMGKDLKGSELGKGSKKMWNGVGLKMWMSGSEKMRVC